MSYLCYRSLVSLVVYSKRRRWCSDLDSGCICGAIRLVSTTRALGADDITFNIGPIGLWSIGEVTSGFLILCIPSVPKAFRDTIFTRKISDLANRMSGRSSNVNSRRGLPTWYHPQASQRPHRSEFSEIEECEEIPMRPDAAAKPVSERKSLGNDRVRILQGAGGHSGYSRVV